MIPLVVGPLDGVLGWSEADAQRAVMLSGDEWRLLVGDFLNLTCGPKVLR